MATSPTSPALSFTVRRHEIELVAPAKPMPREQKLLSDIDDQSSFRFQTAMVQIYRHNPTLKGNKEPAKVIREALARALVFYYPLAGRLRELANGKLMVDCTGEGVLFIEAEADVTLEQLGGDGIQLPLPCFDELLYDVPGSGEILNCPVLLIQVTKLKCGGFIVAHRFNHVFMDGTGMFEFMSAVAEMARGGQVTPSIPPVWERHLLDAPNPPQVLFTHHEYDQVLEDTSPLTDVDGSLNLVQRCFFFGSNEYSLLRSLLPPHLHQCTTRFELLAACLWRCRTIAINLEDPTEEVRLLFPINMRSKFSPPLPSGYYGNAFVFPAAITTSGKLCRNPLVYGVELVKQAKAMATEEYVKSVASLMVIKGKRLGFPDVGGTYIVTDLTKFGFPDVDYGWGKAVFGGSADCVCAMSDFLSAKDKKGETGTLVPICLPATAMERFAKELDIMLQGQPCSQVGVKTMDAADLVSSTTMNPGLKTT